MLYIYLDTNTIKIMHLKKSMLGQYEASFYKKTLQVPLLDKGIPANPDVIASGIKEALAMLPTGGSKDRDVTLVLPQETFMFLKCDVPADIAENVLGTYLKEKARSEKNFDIVSGHYGYIVRENEGIKKVVFYGTSNETVEAFSGPLKLIELNLTCIVPESLTYFKLFEKTLRTNKKENIWYVSYDQDELSGYGYDSYGLLDDSRWKATLTAGKKIEKVIQKKAAEYETAGTKLNRLILSGAQSESIRQDTFTKEVGVWTNPLKRIIPHFYSDYLKMLGGPETKEIPVLEYDMLVGAFIFNAENKSFTLMNASNTSKSGGFSKPSLPSISLPNMSIPVKGIALFVISFLFTFGALYGVSKLNPTFLKTFTSFNVALPGKAKPTPTIVTVSPTPVPPTVTPTPSFDRTTVRISVENGSGIVGKASKVKEFLRSVGYEELLTANADSFDYTTTVIQSKKGAESVRDIVAADIKSELTASPEFEVLDENDAADIVIIVGTDFR